MPGMKCRTGPSASTCIVPIHFRGHKFYLKRKLPGPAPFAFRYELAAWHSELGSVSSLAIHYDEDYVAEREYEFARFRKQDHLHSALFALYPLLGFCWSGFKERVLGPIGFEPAEITEASIMLTFGFFVLEGVFVCYFRLGLLALAFSLVWLLWLDYALFVLLPLDCAVRFGRVVAGDPAPRWLPRMACPTERHGPKQ